MEQINATIRTACYTNHKTGQTAVALTLDTNFEDLQGSQTFNSNELTYARLWLEAIGKVVIGLQKRVKHGNLHLKLISGDPNCIKMAAKIELMYVKLLKRKKEVTADVIDKVVYAQGQFKRLPNDDLYINVLTLLWNCKNRYDHFIIEHACLDTSTEYRMAKLACDPDIMKKRIPLKG